MTTRDDFRQKLILFSERAIKLREHLKNEEATKLALVQPFISLLGYDDRDPTEVAAEHGADFSEKYKNRVDYAILKGKDPVIAIECKTVGNGRKDDRGQLKAYFNASKTVKLGILTDGILYDFFVDSNEPNLMDEEPFLSVDFAAISAGRLTDTIIDGLFGLQKGKFDPTGITENARMNLTYRAFHDYLAKQFGKPSVEFTRFLLRSNDIKHVRESAIKSYEEIAKKAFQDVFNAHVIQQLNIPAQSVQKAVAERPIEAPIELETTKKEIVSGVETTPEELEAFEEIRRHIAFLCGGSRDLFQKVEQISYKDYQGKFVIFLGKERKGRLIDLVQNRDGSFRYILADGLPEAEFSSIDAMSGRLLNLFRRQVEAL